MTEATQPAATQPGPVNVAQAAQMLAERRQPQKPDVSAHASAMGKRSAEVRQQRMTEATAAPQVEETGEPEQDDTAQTGETLNEEASGEPSTTQTEVTEGESDPQTIDLGDGVKVTLDEVRDGFMLKADHTRKTQALSEDRKAFESDRTQRLSILDNLIGVAQAQLGQPKSMKQWLAEDPVDGMMRFAEQQERLETFGNLLATRQQEQAHHVTQLKQATLKGLETKHGDKAEGVFSKAVQYVASKTNTDQRAVEAMLSHPEAIEMVNDAMAYRELKSNEKNVTKVIAEKPKVVKPGVRVSAQSQAHSDAQSARAKLQQSGSLADAVAFLQAQRKTGGRG